MRRHLLVTCVILFAVLGQAYSQQDAQFSQYMFNGLYINPAYAGYREQWNVNTFYRNQWTGFPGAPKTISIAADGVANENRIGLGAQLISDKAGAQNNTALYGNYAFRIPMGEVGNKMLALGLGAGVIYQHLDIAKLDPKDQNDPELMNAQKTAIMPDAKVGVFYNSDRIYAGLSADNLAADLFRKKDALKRYIPMKPHLYLTAGGLVPISEEVLFKPSFLIKEDFAGPTSLDLNAFVLIKEKLWVGGSYRTAILSKNNIARDLTKSGAIVGMVELMVNEKLRVGYAYDKTTNGTAANNNSTHELSLTFFFPQIQAAMKSPRYF